MSSGRALSAAELGHAAVSLERPVRLERAHLVPGRLDPGGTELVLQRHGEYRRDREAPDAGSLTPEAIRLETEAAAAYVAQLLAGISPSERQRLHFLFVASDTAYAGGGQRSLETVTIAQRVTEVLLAEHDVQSGNILNLSHDLMNRGAPRPMRQLREPRMFADSPDFVAYLREQYGDMGKDFWIVFEEDAEREARLDFGAEGPDEIADRMHQAVRVFSRYARLFHQARPESRLVIWASTHYDTISPFVKRDILHLEKRAAVLVGHGGGLTIDIAPDGVTTAAVAGQQYSIEL